MGAGPADYAHGQQFYTAACDVYCRCSLADAAAILLSVALSMVLPSSKVNAIALTVLLTPVLRGSASYWVCADPKKICPILLLIIATCLSAALIYV